MTPTIDPGSRADFYLSGSSPDSRPPVSMAVLWIGRMLSALPVLMMMFSAAMKFAKPPTVLEGFTHLGWPERYAMGLGVVEVAVTLIYFIPRTAVLGAILVTGYLGGAIATHVRLGEAFVMPALLGVLVWLGLYLRDRRVRSLLPLRAASVAKTE